MVIVAQDIDFAMLLAKRNTAYPSVVLIRQRLKLSEDVLGALVMLMPMVEADLVAGAVVVVGDDRIRVRRLPLGVIG